MIAFACIAWPLLAPLASALAVARKDEVLVPLSDGTSVALSTRGPSAFRARLLEVANATDRAQTPSPMVEPDESNAAYIPISWHSFGENTTCQINSSDTTIDGMGTTRNVTASSVDECKSFCEQAEGCYGIEWGAEKHRCEFWTRQIGAAGNRSGYHCYSFSNTLGAASGISARGLGSLSVSPDGRLVLRGVHGELLTESEPLAAGVAGETEISTSSAPLSPPGSSPVPSTPGRRRFSDETMVHVSHASGALLAGASVENQIWSGDTVALRAHTGKFLEADGTVLRATAATSEDWQQWLIVEGTDGSSVIRDGDTVFLHTYATGSALQLASGGAVHAHTDMHDEQRSFVVERKYGPGIVQSGETVFLRNSKRYMHVEGEDVAAKWEDKGEWQTLTIEKIRSGSSFLRSGDSLFLEDNKGKLLAPNFLEVEATGNEYSATQRWLIEKTGAPPGSRVMSGDLVFLLTNKGTALDIEVDVVKARWDYRGPWQQLTIWKVKGTGPVRQGDQVLFKSHIGPYIDVQEATQVRAQSYVPVPSMVFRVELGAPTCKQASVVKGRMNVSSVGGVGYSHFDTADESIDTFWVSNTTDHEWVSIDLEAELVPSRVEVNWGSNYAKSFFVQGSQDGSNFVTMALSLGRKGWVVTQLPRSSPLRYLRILGRQRANMSEGYTLSEIIVFACQRTIRLSSKGGLLYGKGAGVYDAHELTATDVKPQVCDRATWVPYYYSTDGYGALGVVSNFTDPYQRQIYPASYQVQDGMISWGYMGSLDLYLMPAAKLSEGTAAYMALTGAPRVPPRYAFGFMASRWGWQNSSYIEETVKNFRKGGFPLDSVVLDVEWYSNLTDYNISSTGESWFQDFGYSKSIFPKPEKQLHAYKKNFSLHVGGIRKPRLANAGFIEMARHKGWLLPGGTPGGTFPPDGSSRFAFHRSLDFSLADVRKWYGRQLRHLIEDGFDFWWNDDGETDYFTYYWWNSAEIDALRSFNQSARFYSLNRAFTPGLARLGGTTLTGDVEPSWEDLRRTPGVMLNWGLAGAPYVGCDIGGFTGSPAPDLLVRWMQVGIFMPTMRVHSFLTATPHWPWLYGDEAAAAMKSALDLRYRLIPYHYSLAHKMYTARKLWIRPMVMDFPDDRSAAALTTQWMDGEILVAPVLRSDGRKQVYLPEGKWYHFNSSQYTEGPIHFSNKATFGEVPAFVQPGTIIVLAPVTQNTADFPGGPLEVHVYSGKDCSFDLVEDDGVSVDYESGMVRTTTFRWYDSMSTLSWRARGSFKDTGSRAFANLTVTIFNTTSKTPVLLPSTKLGDGGSLASPARILHM